MPHYWNVQDLDGDGMTCGHQHPSEALAWACLDRQTEPDAWGVYEHLVTPGEGHTQALAGDPWTGRGERGSLGSGGQTHRAHPGLD